MGKLRTTRPRHRRRTPCGEGIGPRPERLEDRTLPAVTAFVGPNVNISRLADVQAEGTIAINPTNPSRLFSASITYDTRPGVFASISADGGTSWQRPNNRDLATGGPGGDSLPEGTSDPQSTFDSFGNLFLTYIAGFATKVGATDIIEMQRGQSSGNNQAKTFNDNTRSWATDVWKNMTLRITGGLGMGQTRMIVSNDSTTLTLDRPWDAGMTPDATSTYDIEAPQNRIIVVRSDDSGQTFKFQSFVDNGMGDLDQPSIATGAGSVWVDWAGNGGTVYAAGAKVNSQGDVGAFTAPMTVAGGVFGNFGSIAIGPSGQVLVNYERGTDNNRGQIFTSLDPAGLTGSFNAPALVTETNVGVAYTGIVPAQMERGTDAEANLAWDRNRGPNGRVYLVYTDAKAINSPDTDIYLKYSDDLGTSWSASRLVNDANANSQFLPAIAVDPITGFVAVTWYDARNDTGAGGPDDTDGAPNTEAQIYGTFSQDGGDSFLKPNIKIGAHTSNSYTPSVYVSSRSTYNGANPNTATTLVDTSQAWQVDEWKDYLVRIITGRGAGQERKITANTATRLTIDAGTPWTTIPDNTSRYVILYAGAFNFGDYTSLDFYNGAFYPVWADNTAALVPGRPALDLATAKVTVSSSNTLANFDGLNRRDRTVQGPEPPDPQIAVGPSQVMEAVNFGLATFDKNTGTRISTQSLSTFFAPLNPGTLFDPALTYDETLGKNGQGQVQSRFIVAAADVDNANQKAYVDIAISNDSDATHGFTEMRRIDVSESILGGLIKLWGSYTRIGWNADAVVLTVNMNQFPFALEAGGPYDHVQLLSLNATTLNDANNATFSGNKFDISGFPPFFGLGNFSLVPAVMHGTVSGGAEGGPMWFVEEGSFIPLVQTTIRLIRVDKILAATLTGTSFDVPVPQYRYLLPKRQPGPGGSFDASADTRINSVAFRDNRLVAAQTVGTGTILNRGPDHARWYDFNVGGAAPTLTQSGEIDRGPNVDTSYPSIEIATNGDLGLTYMESGPNEFISMGITGRAAADPAGTLRPVSLVRTGRGSYTGSRLGDYSGMAVDPIKGTTFWAVNAYKAISNGTTWGTAIAAFTFQDAAPRPADVIDNRNMAYRDVGPNWKLLNSGYRGDARINDGGASTEYARWVFNRPSGRYEVFITWQVALDGGTVKNSSIATYNVYDGATKIATISVNQKVAPDSLVFDGAQWKLLGLFTTKNNGLTIELLGDPNASVVADAVFIVDPPAPVAPSSSRPSPAGVRNPLAADWLGPSPTTPTASLQTTIPRPASVDLVLADAIEPYRWLDFRPRRWTGQSKLLKTPWGSPEAT